MKNTKNEGVLHFRVFKWNGRYLGICLETGFVEEADSFEVAERKVVRGIVALIEAVWGSRQNLERSLNTRPPFRYMVMYYFAPLLSRIESKRSSPGYYGSFARPIHSFHAA